MVLVSCIACSLDWCLRVIGFSCLVDLLGCFVYCLLCVGLVRVSFLVRGFGCVVLVFMFLACIVFVLVCMFARDLMISLACEC